MRLRVAAGDICARVGDGVTNLAVGPVPPVRAA